jgi:sodium-dependent dicarboxylate transporter 2/3/5
MAFLLGAVVLALPRPDGSTFKIIGDIDRSFYQTVSDRFTIIPGADSDPGVYVVHAKADSQAQPLGAYLRQQASVHPSKGVEVVDQDGLSPKAQRFLAVLAVLIFLFMLEPIPLEITAILIGVLLVVMQIVDVKTAWAPYMHPVVVFIMCCLIFAIALDKAGITKRLGHFIVAKAGTSVTKFTFIISVGLGLASSFMHDAAAVSIGIVTMLPLMRSAGIEPHSRTAKFMLISLAFACSCGGMGTLVGGGRTMVSAAFLKEFTGIEISFMYWIKYAMPMAIVTVPAAVGVVYLVFRPDPAIKLPKFDDEVPPWSQKEIVTLLIIVSCFILWLTKEIHGLHYSVTGMVGVAALVLADCFTELHGHRA